MSEKSRVILFEEYRKEIEKHYDSDFSDEKAELPTHEGEADFTKNTLSVSIDELMKEKSEYDKEEEKKKVERLYKDKRKSNNSSKGRHRLHLIICWSMVLLVVFITVILLILKLTEVI